MPDIEQPPKIVLTSLFASYDRRCQHLSQGFAIWSVHWRWPLHMWTTLYPLCCRPPGKSHGFWIFCIRENSCTAVWLFFRYLTWKFTSRKSLCGGRRTTRPCEQNRKRCSVARKSGVQEQSRERVSQKQNWALSGKSAAHASLACSADDGRQGWQLKGIYVLCTASLEMVSLDKRVVSVIVFFPTKWKRLNDGSGRTEVPSV